MKAPAVCLLFLLGFALPVAPVRGDDAQAEHRFDVFEYVVEGNSVLPAPAIERAVYRFLGEKKQLGDVEKARESLERAYKDAGYMTVIVDIPEQKVEGGTVRLAVTEAPINRLRVTGSRYYSLGAIKERVPALAEGEVPYFPDVQKQLAQLSGSPDRRVTPVLRAGRTPGTVEAELKVEDELPVHGALDLNNRYSLDTEELRLNASLQYGNLWQRDHSISLSFNGTPEDFNQVKVFSGTYVMPLRPSGNLLALYAVKSDSQVSSVGSLQVIGRGSILGARYIVPMRPRGALNHSMSFGVDYKDFEEDTVFGSDTFNTPISYSPFQVQYSGNVSSESGPTEFSLAANFSLRGLSDHNIDCGGQELNEFECKRHGAEASYFFLRGDVSHLRSIFGSAQLFLRGALQLAHAPLISNEQFGAGGADSVRGYAEFERTGDWGAYGTVELRSPSLYESETSGLREVRASAFIDGGKVFVNDALPGQEDQFSLASIGTGLRLKAGKYFNGELDFAQPLREDSRGKRDLRIHFKVAHEF